MFSLRGLRPLTASVSEKFVGIRGLKLFSYLLYGLLFILFQLTACSSEPENLPAGEATPPENKKQSVRPPKKQTCGECHHYRLDSRHAGLECTNCHEGASPASGPEKAHKDLVDHPAHPANMVEYCGKCHPEQVGQAEASIHFTLASEVNTVRKAFGTNETIASLKEIPVVKTPESPLELADDMLRRRCLHCHVYWSGDLYAETTHGTGCAACHLEYGEGKLQSHKFLAKPPDRRCLACHHANHAGGDYYGMFEHDFHWAYRTPYSEEGLTPERPYGVENHSLSPDLHQEAGMACIDCHNGRELMTADPGAGVSCLTCHQWAEEEIRQRENLSLVDGRLLLTARISGKILEVPFLDHPAHKKYGEKVSCQVCHAKWAYNDIGTHLIRLDIQDYEPWRDLDVQSSFEAEAEITDALYGEGDYPYPFMQDKITGQSSRGLWLKGFELRRWEKPVFCRDKQGVLQVCRPILDLHLSWVNKGGEVVFDAVTPAQSPAQGLLPYTPHTTGNAGSFFRQRLRENTELLEEPYFLNNHTEEK